MSEAVFGAGISLIGLGSQPPDPDWGATGSQDGPHAIGAAPATRPEPHRH